MAGVEPFDLQRLSETVLGLVTQVAEMRGLIAHVGDNPGTNPETSGERLLRMLDADRTRMDRIDEMASSLQTELRS